MIESVMNHQEEIKDQQGISTDQDLATTDLVVGTEAAIVVVTSADQGGETVGDNGGFQKLKETDFETSKEVSVVNSKANVVEEPEPPQTCVIDVKCSNVGRVEGESCDGERVCRICHLGADPPSENSDMIQLGCGCKDELGIAHRHCAETWFKLKGNRCCEICGVAAKNITGMWDDRFMEDWNDRRSVGSNSLDRRWGFWRGQPFCNFLMACLVMAFVLPWFFRVNMF